MQYLKMRFYVPTSLLSSDLAIKRCSEGVKLILDGIKSQDGFWGRGGVLSGTNLFSLPAAPSSPGNFFISGNSRIGTPRAQKGEAIVQQRLLSFSPNGNAFMS